MKFAPKTEQELYNLLPAGIYDCEVMEAEDKVSTAGNDMIAMRLSVFDKDGKRHTVKDYLMEKLAYKLRHAAYAFGLSEDYEKGTLEGIDMQGKAGKVKIKITRDPEGKYPDKNEVVDYIVPPEGAKTVTKAQRDATLGDQIPF